MTLDQGLIVGLLIALLIVFALDRFRIEIVALAGLACGVLLGLVPGDRAFSGLSNPAVVTVIEILLIVQALDESHLDAFADWLRKRASPRRAVIVLCAAGAGVSSVMNNVGAYALTLPVAFSLARSAGLSKRSVLMPLSFATLLGGLCSLIGTPANLIVSNALQQATGTGFRFLDFAPTGVAVTIAGLAVIAIWAPRALASGLEPVDEDSSVARRIVTEVRLPGTAAALSIGELSTRIVGTVHTVVRDGQRLFPLTQGTDVQKGDLLLLDADTAALRAALATGQLVTARGDGAGSGSEIEAAIMPQSTLVGSRIAAIEAFSDRGIRVLAVTTQNPRIEGRLDQLQLGIGDILRLEGDDMALRDAVEETALLELAAARRLDSRKVSPIPIVTFALGILVAALGLAPPEIALGAVVISLAASKALDLRVALAGLNWPIVLLLVAMLPLGEAVASTGAAATIAGALIAILPMSSPVAVCVLALGLAMLVTPFVNNATTAVILAPIAVEVARDAGVSPALALMAVAIGASSDFLTPFGHHNNTLAYGLGEYRFADFLRMGWPVSIAAFVAGVASCSLVWS
jgi:di/tricarboxylate transporter